MKILDMVFGTGGGRLNGTLKPGIYLDATTVLGVSPGSADTGTYAPVADMMDDMHAEARMHYQINRETGSGYMREQMNSLPNVLSPVSDDANGAYAVALAEKIKVAIGKAGELVYSPGQMEEILAGLELLKDPHAPNYKINSYLARLDEALREGEHDRQVQV